MFCPADSGASGHRVISKLVYRKRKKVVAHIYIFLHSEVYQSPTVAELLAILATDIKQAYRATENGSN